MMENSAQVAEGFVHRATKIVIGHLDDADFSVRDLAHHLHFSREQTHRKLKKKTGLSSGKFIRYIRLLYAYHYLVSGGESVQEIGYRVGFSNPTYFNKCFKEAWKITPGKVDRGADPKPPADLPILAFYRIPDVRNVLQESGIDLDRMFNFEARNTAPKTFRKWASAILFLVSGIFLVGSLIQSSPPNVPLSMADQRLAVAPFVNSTGDTSLQAIGEIASSWISSQLDELEKVKTVPFFTVKQYSDYLGILPDDRQGRPTFGEVVEASYLIQGQFFLKEGTLFFDTELLDAKTQQSIYHLPMVSGQLDSVMQVVETLRQKVAGLVAGLEEVQLGKLTPPSYQAYLFYLNGLEEMRNGYYSPKNAQENFEKAVAESPDFVMANIYLKMFFYGYRQDSIFARIEQVPRITQYERNVLQHLRLRMESRFDQALELSLNMLNAYPRDFYFNLFAGHEAKSLFMPQLAIRILSHIQDPVIKEAGLVWHYFKVRNYTEALMALGEYQQALDFLESIPSHLFNPAIPELMIYNHIRMGKGTEAIEALIDKYDERVNKKIVADYYSNAAYEYALIHEDEAARYFIDKASELMYSFPDERGHDFDLVDLLFLSGDYSGARKQLEKIKPENEVDYWLYLSFIEAAAGNAGKALAIFDRELTSELIPWRRNPVQYQADYLKARVYALLGQEEMAIDFLERALQKGQLFHHLDFHRDIFLKPIFNHPRFKALTRPREYQGEITIGQ